MSIARTEEMDRLFDTVLGLQSPEECYAFFEDLLTVKELTDAALRLRVAFLLDEGLSYQQVALRAGVSPATICRVKKCLENGSGGYRTVIARAKEARDA